MAKIIVHGEEVFRAQKDQFAVSPTSAGYTVAYSANGVDFTNDTDAVVPANENLIYNGCMTYGFYKLVGNADNVEVLV
jgi:hypothetical protein